MQQIAAYGSDTDDEEGLADEKNTFQESSNCEENAHKAIATALGNTSHPNFFGLADSEGTSEYKSTEAHGFCWTDSSDSERTVQLAGSRAEIPGSDFWKDFKVTDIPADVSPDDLTSSKRKSSDFVVAQSHVKKKLASNCNRTNIEQVHLDPWEHQNTTDNSYSDNRLKTELILCSDRQTVTENQTKPAVKIYSVHPKIAPLLNSSQANKCPSRQVNSWTGHSCVINRLAWCCAASFSHLLCTASMDSTVRIWNAWAQQQPCVQTLQVHRKAVRDAQWSADGRNILSCSYDRTAAITDVQTGHCHTQFDHSNFVSAGKFHPVTPNLLATGTTDCIQIWDTRSPDVPCRMFTYKEQLGQVHDLVFSSDGQEIFSCSDVVTRDSADRSIMAWDFRTGVILSNQIFQERYTVTRLCLHPCTSQFLAQTQAGYIAVFSTHRPYKMNKNKRFEGHKTAGYSIGMSVSQDGSLVYSGCAQGKLHCYNFQTGRRIRTLDCGDVVLDVATHPVLPTSVVCATWGGMLYLFQ